MNEDDELPLFSSTFLSEPDICRNYHGGNEESEAANLQTDKARDRSRIVRYFLENEWAICDQVEVALDMRHQTCSARIAELKRDGVLVKTGDRWATRTGSMAAVLKLAERYEQNRPK